MTDRTKSATRKENAGATIAKPITQGAYMKSFLQILLAVVMVTGVSAAKELPDAPSAEVEAEAAFVETSVPVTAPRFVEKPVIDKKFISLALVSTGSTFADSYTTMFATQNWLAGKKGVCNMEVQSAYLYGTHPTTGRVYAVASVKSAVSIFSAYYLRKHHSKFWSLPLIANSAISLEGVTQNMMSCN
jgi:hypothetical protein